MREAICEIDKLLEECKRQEPSFIPDGAVQLDRYIVATPRILWILKEPNGPGEWDLRDYFRETLFGYPRWYATAGLMIRVTHGLLNSCVEWGDWANDARQIADCLRDVAIININKRGGDSRAKSEPLERAGVDFADLIMAQVSAFNPQIVILAGSYQFLPTGLRSKLVALESCDSYATIYNGALFVSAYHPNQMTITHKEYYDQIVTAITKHNSTLRRRNAEAN